MLDSLGLGFFFKEKNGDLERRGEMGDWETKREQWRQRGERFGKTESGRGS